MPSNKLSISIVACVDEDNVFFRFSLAVLNRLSERLFSDKSFLCFLLKSCTKCCTRRVSKSSPPKRVSPAVAFTSKTPPSIVRSVTSKVPPPRS